MYSNVVTAIDKILHSYYVSTGSSVGNLTPRIWAHCLAKNPVFFLPEFLGVSLLMSWMPCIVAFPWWYWCAASAHPLKSTGLTIMNICCIILNGSLLASSIMVGQSSSAYSACSARLLNCARNVSTSLGIQGSDVSAQLAGKMAQKQLHANFHQ